MRERENERKRERIYLVADQLHQHSVTSSGRVLLMVGSGHVGGSHRRERRQEKELKKNLQSMAVSSVDLSVFLRRQSEGLRSAVKGQLALN